MTEGSVTRAASALTMTQPAVSNALARLRDALGDPLFVRSGTGIRPTQRAVLDALEERYPTLRGTIRDHGTAKRRDFIRFFACGQDITLESPDDPLPEEVVAGTEPLRIVGAMAGG